MGPARDAETSQAGVGPLLSVDIEPGVPASVVVPVRGLVQSLGNLVRNAMEAGGPVDAVRLRVRTVAERVHFDVEDSGVGIPQETLARVGEPFFSTKAPGKGMGLGLFLAHAFAERWRGRLALESEPGRGTRASLELPLRLEASDAR